MRSSDGTTEADRLHSSKSSFHAIEANPEMVPSREVTWHVILGSGSRSTENPENKIFRSIVAGRKAEVCLVLLCQFGGDRPCETSDTDLRAQSRGSVSFQRTCLTLKKSGKILFPNSIAQRRIEKSKTSLRGK